MKNKLSKENEKKIDVKNKEKYNPVFLFNLSDVKYYEKLFRCDIEKQRQKSISILQNSKKIIDKLDINLNYSFNQKKKKNIYLNKDFQIFINKKFKRKNNINELFQIIFKRKPSTKKIFIKNNKLNSKKIQKKKFTLDDLKNMKIENKNFRLKIGNIFETNYRSVRTGTSLDNVGFKIDQSQFLKYLKIILFILSLVTIFQISKKKMNDLKKLFLKYLTKFI